MLGQAKQAEKQNDWKQMVTILKQAVEVESSHATSWYLLGSAYNQIEQYTEALNAREQSLMLDLSRKRSLPAYANIAEEICAKRHCKVVNAHTRFQKKVEQNGMIVYEQMWGDHEHLTPEGCTFIATLFAEIIP